MAAQTIRQARADDYAHFVRFFAELHVPEAPPVSDAFARNLAPSAFFLEEAGTPVGYVCCYAIGLLGYVMHVVVAPEARGRGVGRALLQATAERLRAAGCSRWTLNVKPDNVPAIRLYERFGLRATTTSVSLRVRFARLDALAPSDRELVGVLVADGGGEDASIEAAFDLPRGMLAQRRALGRILLRLQDPRVPADVGLGFAAFDPSLPGASPFRLGEPTYARAMLEALRARARPEHEAVRVNVEGDPPLAAHLRAAGAETALEVVRMEGELPR